MLSGATVNGVLVSQMSSFSGFATTGDSDVSLDGTASQFLLLRGLEPGVTEELLAKGVSKLYKTKAGTPPIDAPAAKKTKISSTTNDASLGAKEGSLRRVLLVRDRKSNDSWRYGFAEFNTVEDAQAAMVKYNSSDKFTISSKPVMISYIHSGVFVPVLNYVGEAASKYMFSPLSNAAVQLSYWDQAAYASEHATAAPIRASAGRGKESEHVRLAAAAGKEGLLGPGKDGEPRLKKRKMEKESKPVAPHLQFWTNRHAELHGQAASKDTGNKETDTSTTTSHAGSSQPAVQDPPSTSFADLNRKCCLLCSRQFKGEADLNKHERLSQLHRDNLKDEDLVNKALAKINKSSESTAENSAYRDRAKERRQAFNQPKQPASQHNRAPKEESETEEEPIMPAPSKGAALLGKMGWSVGEGLGAQGTGRTEAIKTKLYSQGVGLGAQGGRVGDAAEEAQKQTKNNSYADFVSNVKDRAKERFDSLK